MRACTLLVLLSVVGGGWGNYQVYELALQILMKLHSKSALKLVANSTAHETHLQVINEKRSDVKKDIVLDDEDELYKRNDAVYTTNSYKFPVDSYIKNAMLAILGEDGVLEKGGFYMDGYIKKDGTAFIKMFKSFGNRTNLIDEIEKARQNPGVDSPLAVIVHLLLANQDTENLIAWQKEHILKGNLKQNDPCAPKMVVMYKCCTPTVLPLIGPIFGTLRIATD